MQKNTASAAKTTFSVKLVGALAAGLIAAFSAVGCVAVAEQSQNVSHVLAEDSSTPPPPPPPPPPTPTASGADPAALEALKKSMGKAREKRPGNARKRIVHRVGHTAGHQHDRRCPRPAGVIDWWDEERGNRMLASLTGGIRPVAASPFARNTGGSADEHLRTRSRQPD
nr:hypothetical protein GCM10020093_073160 [Planobispora longispora]